MITLNTCPHEVKVGVRYIMYVNLMLLIITEVSDTRRFPMSSIRKFRTHRKPTLRVIHGWPDSMNEYPYVIALIFNETYYRSCTGSLIKETWVLTAAHCISPDLAYVRCGNMSIPWEETKCKSKILEQIVHPSYIESDIAIVIDIALVRIEGLTKHSLGRLHGADFKTLIGRAVRFAGFGMTYHSYDFGPAPYDELWDKDEKRELQVGEGVIFEVEELIAVAPKCTDIRHSPYFGDSGGPLIVDGKIVGVLALLIYDYMASGRYIDEKHPDHYYYIPVSPYLNWIRWTINSKTRH
ncbi:mast cell protease 3-like [Plodia interpunctella]|uniref:mast cell protease 3-like n=1 Tax=Plodia interpunctella TaxID=58824 RepID=UPI002367CB0B|nr:mast cell protease 3-like [Plodia interpunctella]